MGRGRRDGWEGEGRVRASCWMAGKLAEKVNCGQCASSAAKSSPLRGAAAESSAAVGRLNDALALDVRVVPRMFLVGFTKSTDCSSKAAACTAIKSAEEFQKDCKRV